MAEKTQKNPLGPTGERVRMNVERIRKAQGLTYRGIADRLAELGRPIPTLGLSRIERGERRVDADDLVALSIVLGVNPNALLFPDVADTTPAEVTGAERLNTAYEVWQWADGRDPLRDDDDPDEFHVRVRPKGRRHLVRRGERSREELRQKRRRVEQMGEQFGDSFVKREMRSDPEPWEEVEDE